MAPFRCGVCPQRFQSFALFRKHFNRSHKAGEAGGAAVKRAPLPPPLNDTINFCSVASVTSVSRPQIKLCPPAPIVSPSQQALPKPSVRSERPAAPKTAIDFYPPAHKTLIDSLPTAPKTVIDFSPLAPKTVVDSHPTTPKITINSHPTAPSITIDFYPSAPKTVIDFHPTATKKVIDFYPTAEEASALKHIRLDDGSGLGGRHLLLRRPDGSLTVESRPPGNETRRKKLRAVSRSRHSPR